MSRERIIDVLNRNWFVCLVEPQDQGYIAYAYCEGWLDPEPREVDFENPSFKEYIREATNPFVVSAIGYTAELAKENLLRYVLATSHDWAASLLTRRQYAFTTNVSWN